MIVKAGNREKQGFDEDRRREGFSRKRARPPTDLYLDYKDIETLRPFLTESGRIVPARITRLSRKQQRVLSQEVKRAQALALLPISDRHGSGR